MGPPITPEWKELSVRGQPALNASVIDPGLTVRSYRGTKHTHTHTQTQPHKHTGTHTQAHLHAHKHTHAHKQTHTYTHTHAHNTKRELSLVQSNITIFVQQVKKEEKAIQWA